MSEQPDGKENKQKIRKTNEENENNSLINNYFNDLTENVSKNNTGRMREISTQPTPNREVAHQSVEGTAWKTDEILDVNSIEGSNISSMDPDSLIIIKESTYQSDPDIIQLKQNVQTKQTASDYVPQQTLSSEKLIAVQDPPMEKKTNIAIDRPLSSFPKLSLIENEKLKSKTLKETTKNAKIDLQIFKNNIQNLRPKKKNEKQLNGNFSELFRDSSNTSLTAVQSQTDNSTFKLKMSKVKNSPESIDCSKDIRKSSPPKHRGKVMKLRLWSNRVLARLYTTPPSRLNSNPFVSTWANDKFYLFKLYTIGIFMCIIRLIPIIILFSLNCLLAKLFVILIRQLNKLRLNTEIYRIVGQKLTFFLMRVTFFFFGVYWIKIIDKRKNRNKMSPIITIAPHSSFYDLILVVALRRATFVSRIENLDTPFIGNILRLCKGIYVDRNDKNSRQTTIEAIKRLAQEGECVLIFPEGTCTNRSSLLQFKLGAFLPKLPIQPIIVRWDAGNSRDTVSWTWEGPDHFQVVVNGLTKLSTNCEITILEEWAPNNKEKNNPRLFAENLSRYMCSHLGILQSRYSFDDVPFMALAREMGLFRSPIIFSFLNVCNQYLEHKKNRVVGRQPTRYDSDSSRETIIRNLKKKVTTMVQASMCIVEDAFNNIPISDRYIPKQLRDLDRDSIMKIDQEYKKQDHYFKEALSETPSQHFDTHSEDEYVFLQTTKVWRRKIDPKYSEFLPNVREYRHTLCINFVELINYCVTVLEKDFQYRVLKSVEDVLFVLKLDEFFKDSEAFLFIQSNTHVQSLFRILEQTLSTPVTTAHLLMVLHLCDTREQDAWERMRIAYTILEAMRKAKDRSDDHENRALKTELAKKLQVESDLSVRFPGIEFRSRNKFLNNYIDLDQFRTLLWYTLGLSDFNDLFLIEKKITYDYLKNNLAKIFSKAVQENAEQLILQQQQRQRQDQRL